MSRSGRAVWLVWSEKQYWRAHTVTVLGLQHRSSTTRSFRSIPLVESENTGQQKLLHSQSESGGRHFITIVPYVVHLVDCATPILILIVLESTSKNFKSRFRH